MPILDPYRIAAVISGSNGDYVDVSFWSGKRLMEAKVPVHELFVSVKDILVFEEYEIDPRFRFHDLPPDATVIDAGAFVGLFSLKASPYVKRIISVEPSQKNYSLLSENIKANAITNIFPRRVALSSRRGVTGFRELGSGSSLVTADQIASYDVQTIELRELIEEAGSVELLKLDVEGAEHDILLNTSPSTLTRLNKIVGELHFPPLDRERFNSIARRLKQSGMTVRVLNKPYQRLTHVLTKPWSCPLRGLDGRRASLYRLFLSSVYAMSPVLSRRESVQASGELAILFAYRR